MKRRPVPVSYKAVAVTADTRYITLTFKDDRVLSVPVSHYKEFDNISANDMAECQIYAGGEGIAWENLDVHLNVRVLLGLPEDEIQNPGFYDQQKQDEIVLALSWLDMKKYDVTEKEWYMGLLLPLDSIERLCNEGKLGEWYAMKVGRIPDENAQNARKLFIKHFGNLPE